MRVAVVQMSSGPDIAANLSQAHGLLRQAVDQGIDLAVLPENFGLMPSDGAQRRAAGEPAGRGVQQDWLKATAAELGLWIVGGTLPIAAPDGRGYASSLLVSPQGAMAARYDKIHLFDVDAGGGERYAESASIAPGDAPALASAGALTLGLTVCYDLRFPELYRALVADGAQAFTAPSAFTATTGRAHWDTLLRARAVENLCFMLAPNQCGTHANGRSTWGHSAIISPWGETLAMLGGVPGVAVATLDLGAQADLRARFPALSHRRLNNA